MAVFGGILIREAIYIEDLPTMDKEEKKEKKEKEKGKKSRRKVVGQTKEDDD